MMKFFEKMRLKVAKTYLGMQVQRELSSGARYERLIFPIEGLHELKLIQLINDQDQSREVIAGLGMSLNEDQSYFLAAVEYYERRSFVENAKKYNLLSTNGIASSLSFAHARHSALSELYERDSFLRHWYTATPFKKIKPELKVIKRLVEVIKGAGIEVLFYETHLGYQVTRVCFLVEKHQRGFVVGLSCGKGEAVDIQKAFFEAVINYFFGHEGITKDKAIERIQNHGFKRLVDHRNYWLYLETFPEWIDSEKDCLTGDLLTPKIEEIYRDNGVVKTVCLHSDHLIPITLGRFSGLDITVQKNYFGANLTINRATDIHPMP